MSHFCEDERIWDRFAGRWKNSTGHRLRVRVFEWTDHTREVGDEIMETVPELLSRDRTSNVRLRIAVVAPSPSSAPELEDFKALFEYYSCPTAPLMERIQSVTHSFGSSTSWDGLTEVSWCHFLAKEVTAEPTSDGLRIVDYGILREQNRKAGDQASSSWIISNVILHVRRARMQNPEKENIECVTLLCFGPPPSLISRFEVLLKNPSWRDVLAEPYLLYGIVFEEYCLLIDRMSWTLADVFRGYEQSTLGRAKGDDTETLAVDFTGLHNVSKHCVFVIEAVDAAMLTLEAMAEHLKEAGRWSPSMLSEAALHTVRHRRQMLQSTQLRLRSLEKRMTNIISLSFHLVTQQDSRVMQVDSIAMKAIALLTLIFLPPLGVAQIFSMPFFYLTDPNSKPGQLQVAGSIWVFVVVAIALPAVMLLLWRWWYKGARIRRMGGLSEKVKLAEKKTKPSSAPIRPLLSDTELSQWTTRDTSRPLSLHSRSFGTKPGRSGEVKIQTMA